MLLMKDRSFLYELRAYLIYPSLMCFDALKPYLAVSETPNNTCYFYVVKDNQGLPEHILPPLKDYRFKCFEENAR